MKLKNLDSIFDLVHNQMKIDRNAEVKWETDKKWNSMNPEEWELLNSTGKDVALSEVQVASDGTLEWKGHKVVLHIFNVRSSYRGRSSTDSLPKFHISECDKLIEMRAQGSFDRYVVSRKKTGIFTINLDRMNREERLLVCKMCLEKLKYDGYTRDWSKTAKDSTVQKFNISDFLAKFEKGFQNIPTYTDENARRDEYPEDWNEISRNVRINRNWTCEECGINLKSDPKFLHVHHRNFIRSDNSSGNLLVVCISCHAFQPNHQHLKKLPDYYSFLKKYKGRAD